MTGVGTSRPIPSHLQHIRHPCLNRGGGQAITPFTSPPQSHVMTPAYRIIPPGLSSNTKPCSLTQCPGMWDSEAEASRGHGKRDIS